MGASPSLDSNSDYSLILFDGVCNLCNGAVQFVIKRDKRSKFKFAPLQSAIGDKYRNEFQLGQKGPYSILLIRHGKVFDKSSAAIEIARELPGLWPAVAGFKIIPKFLRDFFYDIIARNRYRWFGKTDECMIPTPALKARFLEF